MTKITAIILLLLGGLNTIQLHAQAPNLGKDLQFFYEKEAEYRDWLNQTGLGTAISTYQVRLMPILNERNEKIGIDSTQLELLLVLNTHQEDTAAGIWRSLKRAFDSPADSLESVLFRTFVHKMEIDGLNGNIQIYFQNKDGSLNKCFHIYIWEEKDLGIGHRLVSEYHLKGCKDKQFDITIKAPPVKKTGKGKTAKITPSKVKTPSEVFNIIRQHAQETILNAPRYKTDECNDRIPVFESEEHHEYSYKFTLANLGKEVLTDQYRSSWEKLWGYNSIAMERLTFAYEYMPVDNGSGFLLKCTITGKYGSGVFKPRVSGYMNMENDFDDFFDKYKEKIKQQIEQKLK